MRTYRFVHLSDIHFGQEIDGSLPIHEDVRRNLLEDCRLQALQLGFATGVLITGDVAFSGKANEYNRAGEWLEDVTSAVGCKHGDVNVVPGNHDVDVARIDFSSELVHKELRAASASRVDQVLDKIMQADDAANPLLQKFAAYNEFAARYGCDFESARNPTWAKNLEIDSSNTLRFLGLNSGQVSDLSDSIGRMILGNSQYTIYPPAGPRKYEFVVLMHHPLSWFIDRQEAEKYLRRARIIMVGHEHQMSLKKIIREDGSEQLEIYAGATNPNESAQSYAYRYNWLEFELRPTEPPTLSVKVYPRIWNYDDPQFVSDHNRLGGHDSAIFTLACPNFVKANERAEGLVPVEEVGFGVRNLDMENTEAADTNVVSKEDFARLRYFFWKYLDWQMRLEVLVELHIMPAAARQPVPQTMERLALDAAKREHKLAELWSAVMRYVPADKREPNPFEGE